MKLSKLIKSFKLFGRYIRTFVDPSFARLVFFFAPKRECFLPISKLSELQTKYPSPEWNQYDDKSMIERGKSRANELNLMLGEFLQTTYKVLEVGCWDGLVSANLCEPGRIVTAIDYNSYGFHKDALSAGVKCIQMNASHLEFPDNTFDFVFSYDAFEHFQEPDKVLNEIIRVLKPNGIAFFQFGPLYMSPFGLHAELSVPYCQILFENATLKTFCEANRFPQIDFAQVNNWTLSQYRKLFKNASNIKIKLYHEVHDSRHLRLIAEHPSCFKSKSKDFSEFTVGCIEILFRKTV